MPSIYVSQMKHYSEFGSGLWSNWNISDSAYNENLSMEWILYHISVNVGLLIYH